MILRKICIFCLIFASLNSFPASIIIEIPSLSPQLKNASAKLRINQSETSKVLYSDGNYYTNIFCVNEPGLYKVEVTIELLSGELLSDYIAGYINSLSDVSKISATINTNCFNTTFSIFRVTEQSQNQLAPYNLSVDTSLLKRINIPKIDSIADAFHEEGMYWCLELLVHYELLDENYIPLIQYTEGKFRNAITTCQMMFAFHKQYQETLNSDDYRGFINNANWLANNNHSGYYLYDFNFTHDGNTPMRKYWVSAMAQGYAVGALSYAFNVTHDSMYIKEADSVFVTLCHNSSKYWCFLLDNKGYYWLEEYPNKDFCHVLNGKMAALWGIFQYYTISRNKNALRLLEAGLKSVIDNYRFWNVPNNNNSYYCLHHNTKSHYHSVHQTQLTAFAQRFDIAELYNIYYCFLNSPSFVDPNRILFSSLQNTEEILVESPRSWYVEEHEDWLSVSINEGKIVITAENNLTGKIRYATIDVIFDNDDREKISITQEMGYYFRLGSKTAEMDFQEDTLFLTYNTNVSDFNILSCPDWLKIDRINNTLRLICEENQSFIPRISELKIYYENILLANLTVSQKATIPYINLESDTLILSSSDNFKLNVNTNISDIELLSYNNWLSYGWENDNNNIWVSSTNTNSTGRIYFDSPYLTEELIVVSKNFTGNNETPENSEMLVFPNPVNNNLHLKSNNNQTYSFEFKNLLGVTLETGIFNESTTIDVSDYKPGIYIILIKSSTNVSYTYKIVIQ